MPLKVRLVRRLDSRLLRAQCGLCLPGVAAIVYYAVRCLIPAAVL